MTSLLSILALGFFLGMRHATDADHVIAVATIVARERNARSAAVIGAAWGVGHTLTILVVGGAIILLGWVIPPRVGMSMEMAVGAMLCILGLINLRGVTGWLRETDLVPKTQGILGALRETKFALQLARRGKVPPPGPIHVAAEVDEARKLYNIVKEQGRDGALGIVQGERGLAQIEHVLAEDPEKAPAVRIAPEKSGGKSAGSEA